MTLTEGPWQTARVMSTLLKRMQSLEDEQRSLQTTFEQQTAELMRNNTVMARYEAEKDAFEQDKFSAVRCTWTNTRAVIVIVIVIVIVNAPSPDALGGSAAMPCTTSSLSGAGGAPRSSPRC